jgi:pimeloyl-ACP methyl ester carboxylesterase
MFSEFLTELIHKEIHVSFSDGKIKYSGPIENIDSELIENLKKYKGKLIKHLWPPECTNMMPVNTEGNKIPFILLHGEKMNYPLSDYFGKDQPFYGFFHYGSDGKKIFHRSVETFARDYITQLQKVIPGGPYYLGGFSFGGLVAFEMATQLQKQGFDVPVLILIDCKVPMFKEPVIASNSLLKMSIQFYNYSKGIYYWGFHLARKIYFESLLLFKTKLHQKNRNYYIMGTYGEISRRYKPKAKYDGNILLFRTNQNRSQFKYLGWDTLSNNVNLVLLEGDHKTIYNNQGSYDKISKNIGEWLQKANDNLKHEIFTQSKKYD